MTPKLTKEQINNIKISNAYSISILGMNFLTAMKFFLYGMGFVFSLPRLIKYIILFFWTKQEFIAFYEQLPFDVPAGIQSFSIQAGIMMLGFTFMFFKISDSFEKAPDGVVESSRILKKIIYKGKRVRAEIIRNEKDIILIKGKSKKSRIYSFAAMEDEFKNAKFLTLDVGLELKGNRYVYWHPKYPELVIPSSLVY